MRWGFGSLRSVSSGFGWGFWGTRGLRIYWFWVEGFSGRGLGSDGLLGLTNALSLFETPPYHRRDLPFKQRVIVADNQPQTQALKAQSNSRWVTNSQKLQLETQDPLP